MVEPLPDRPVLTVKEAAAANRRERENALTMTSTAGRFPALRVGRVIRISVTCSVLLQQGCVAPPGGIHAGKTRS